MSEKLGAVTYGEREQMTFLPTEEHQNYSEKTAGEIDKEVSNLIANAEKTAEKIIKQKKKVLDTIAAALIEKETIERAEFEKLIGKKKGQ